VTLGVEDATRKVTPDESPLVSSFCYLDGVKSADVTSREQPLKFECKLTFGVFQNDPSSNYEISYRMQLSPDGCFTAVQPPGGVHDDPTGPPEKFEGCVDLPAD
jgi:hypothetical protein